MIALSGMSLCGWATIGISTQGIITQICEYAMVAGLGTSGLAVIPLLLASYYALKKLAK